jgi:hypothetical protein
MRHHKALAHDIPIDWSSAELREGATVTIYMPEELEMAATLRFDDAEKVWWADPI